MSTPREIPADDLVEIRAHLAQASGSGADYWRSLEELAGTERFQHYLHREFPEQAADWTDAESRRHFLKIMGASLALAGVSGCAIRVPEKIAPWVKSPEKVVPGRPQFFATAMTLGGLATGLLVESHAGRPTKIEGNPDHPASLGSTDIFAQAETLALYDPDRSQLVLNDGVADAYEDFLAMFAAERERLRPKKGAGLRILTEGVNSPSLAAQIKDVLAEFPEAKWHRYEPVNKDNARAGARLAFGAVVDPVYEFKNADVILSLDADFLACGTPGRVADERAFAARRDPKPGTMNRLYVAEGQFTNTGAAADHRYPIKPSEIVELALIVAEGVGVEGATALLKPEQTKKTPIRAWADAVARDLKAKKGKGLVLVGDAQPPFVHAVGHAINAALGAIGPEGTVRFVEPIEAEPVDNAASLAELDKDVKAGKVETLLILGGNPAYTAPADLGIDADPKATLAEPAGLTRFGRLIRTVPLAIRLGLHDDETSTACRWHVPMAHFLETWGDARAFDGTVSVVQPLVAPLYYGRTPSEILAALLGRFDATPLSVVQDYWRGKKGGADFATTWKRALHDGLIEGTRAETKPVTVKPVGEFGAKPEAKADGYELIFRPDPTVWDGRYANNGWLQELPKPLTKLTWDNAALVSTATAHKMGLKVAGDDGRVVEIKYQGRTIKAPIFVVPGQADGTIVLHLGYGRTKAGRVGTGVGFNAYALRTSDAPWGSGGAEVVLTPDNHALATTQMQRNIEGRNLLRKKNLGEYAADAAIFHAGEEPGKPSLLDHKGADGRMVGEWEEEYQEHYRWGMAIDLNACTGCNACVISCQAENNIPVVGKDQIIAGRNMQWMEVDTYFSGEINPDDGSIMNEDGVIGADFQPRTCQHCENAPCELVCPVGATLHDAEGLNVMVYNRCVGTRYCGNNCPYKVRHFNFLNYFEESVPSMKTTPSLALLNNPDVTVRSRGVMEKCTYCIQRISGARINAKEEGRKIKDGEVVTACQAACPAQAIHFGDIQDPNSKVAQIKKDQRNYFLLGELNTRPRTTYLGKVRNPNPEIIEA